MRGEAADLVADYGSLISEIVREVPEAGRYLVYCRHCGIAFFTDPRNAGRQDLGCPFGCAEAHRKRESTRRSVAYYQDEDGKKRKRLLNQKRHRLPPAGAPEPAEPAELPPTVKVRPWGQPILEYVRLVSCFIEGRPVSRKEVEELLAKIVRQRSIDHLREIDHIIAKLHEIPP